MLRSRLLWLTLHRKFSETKGHFSVESLCSSENRDKCLNRMKLVTKAVTAKTDSTATAAVLILLVNCGKSNDEPFILYTLRSNKLRKHIRQVSFPGGILEPNDSSYADCALRETEEEIGLNPNRVQLWGETSLVSLRQSPPIMPVIGSIDDYQPEQLKLNFDEVERVFTVPISELCDQRCHTQFRMSQSNESGNDRAPTAYSLPVYATSEERIWGITGIITHLFLQSLLPAHSYHSRIPYISRYR